MRHLLAIALALVALPALAQTQLLKITLYQGTTQTGYICQTVSDKKQAQEFLAKYVASYGKDQQVFAYLHTCHHDAVPVRACVDAILQGAEPSQLSAVSDKATVEIDLKTPGNKATTDNPVRFQVPATKETEDAIIQKIVAEEFVGKEVVVKKPTAEAVK